MKNRFFFWILIFFEIFVKTRLYFIQKKSLDFFEI